jgi:hypothetical protein
MTDEPLIVRVVCSGPLLGSRTVTPAWFICADDVQAAWGTPRHNSRISRSEPTRAIFGAKSTNDEGERTEGPYSGVERAAGGAG